MLHVRIWIGEPGVEYHHVIYEYVSPPPGSNVKALTPSMTVFGVRK